MQATLNEGGHESGTSSQTECELCDESLTSPEKAQKCLECGLLCQSCAIAHGKMKVGIRLQLHMHESVSDMQDKRIYKACIQTLLYSIQVFREHVVVAGKDERQRVKNTISPKNLTRDDTEYFSSTEKTTTLGTRRGRTAKSPGSPGSKQKRFLVQVIGVLQ